MSDSATLLSIKSALTNGPLAIFGGEYSIARPNIVAGANPWDDETAGSPEFLYDDVTAVKYNFTMKEIDGTVVRWGDAKILVEIDEVANPILENQIIYAAAQADIVSATPKYQVVGIKEVNPDGQTIIAYILHVRGIS